MPLFQIQTARFREGPQGQLPAIHGAPVAFSQRVDFLRGQIGPEVPCQCRFPHKLRWWLYWEQYSQASCKTLLHVWVRGLNFSEFLFSNMCVSSAHP